MTVADRFLRPSAVAPFFLAAAMVPLFAGCEKASEVKPEEQRIKVGFVASTICPDQTLTPATGTTQVQATVWAKDGTVAPNVPITFTVTPSDGVDFDGSGAQEVKTTASNGRAIVNFKAPRPTGDSYTFTTTLPTGDQSQGTLSWPRSPFVNFVSANTVPAPGAEFTVSMIVSYVCNIRSFDFDISFDPSLLELESDKTKQGDILNDVTTDGTTSTQTNATLTQTQVSDGLWHVNYARTSTDGKGVNTAGTYLTFTLKANASNTGDAQFKIPSGSMSVVPSVGGPYTMYTSSTSRVAYSTITVTASSSKYFLRR